MKLRIISVRSVLYRKRSFLRRNWELCGVNTTRGRGQALINMRPFDCVRRAPHFAQDDKGWGRVRTARLRSARL
jgi:hypothetical protein